MITSMYFNDINDFINLENGVKRFQGNIERFHFNPIPLNQYSRKLKSYGNTIPSEVKSLVNGCFKGCTSLTTINIPSSITSFGKSCFYKCGCEEMLRENKSIPEYCFKDPNEN
ncbi:hypothetical protein EDI_006520 [Entamoeba dispar SAW760]|uniref:Leucine rich repeat containing protein BspA family protein n=1 Tax=Entamoeba dispar (strain ATCC PRA-260 / SAW760) TaxID=370354 RepID=B0EPN4_ENTDS|nr:uncharacterized protein EDI_006520 [Entamoeba dispar SAW760]EDR23511.1 hypothetical protein EDI_006520 [Entamoeba dispar SAW760]|eukprot:EDR23511.1 hypothetical protein EDI_006520 [Entamoeba dispar SAW760]